MPRAERSRQYYLHMVTHNTQAKLCTQSSTSHFPSRMRIYWAPTGRSTNLGFRITQSWICHKGTSAMRLIRPRLAARVSRRQGVTDRLTHRRPRRCGPRGYRHKILNMPRNQCGWVGVWQPRRRLATARFQNRNDISLGCKPRP